MTTPAELAATVREALTDEGPYLAQLETALVALDALQSQVEEVEAALLAARTCLHEYTIGHLPLTAFFKELREALD